MNKIEIKSVYGDVLFSYECEDNTTKTTLIKAVQSGANLSRANLSRADLEKIYRTQFCIVPEGNVIGWKKLANGSIAKLMIPKEAKRTNSIIGRKCRAEYVDVLEIFGESSVDKHTGKTVYETGKRVHPDRYDDSLIIECTNGIHFFITREEAEAY
jgi:hypothetical protein